MWGTGKMDNLRAREKLKTYIYYFWPTFQGLYSKLINLKVFSN